MTKITATLNVIDVGLQASFVINCINHFYGGPVRNRTETLLRARQTL